MGTPWQYGQFTITTILIHGMKVQVVRLSLSYKNKTDDTFIPPAFLSLLHVSFIFIGLTNAGPGIRIVLTDINLKELIIAFTFTFSSIGINTKIGTKFAAA
jgi:hypothetical protein